MLRTCPYDNQTEYRQNQSNLHRTKARSGLGIFTTERLVYLYTTCPCDHHIEYRQNKSTSHQTHARFRPATPKLLHAHTHTRTHTDTHTRARTHARTHAHTHTHKHTPHTRGLVSDRAYEM